MPDPKEGGPPKKDEGGSGSNSNSNSKEAPQAPPTPTKSALAASGQSPKHDRTVSWGGVIPELKKAAQPGTPAGKSDTSNVSPMSANSPVPASSQQQKSPSQKISLSDVVQSKPMEQEAQTHILRVLEKMQAGNYKPPENHDPQEDNLYRDIASGEISRAAAEKEKSDAAAAKDEEQPTDEEKAEKESLLGNENSSQQKSQTSATRTSGGVMAKGRFKSLVQKNIMNKQDKGVEHTLYGLTAALQAEKKRRKEEESAAGRLASSANALAGNTNGRGDVENQAIGGGAGNDDEPYDDTSDSEDSEDEADTGAGGNGQKKRKKKKHKHNLKDHVTDGIEENWHVFSQYFNPKNDKVEKYVRKVGMFVVLPALGLAFFFFYVIRNPELCRQDGEQTSEPTVPPAVAANVQANVVEAVNGTSAINGTATRPPSGPPKTQLVPCVGGGASTSWWLIFLGVRQVVTFTMALITQVFLIDFLALGTRLCLNWLGPVLTMFLVQSRGWPFLAVFWSVFDLILLNDPHDADESDRRAFAHHWAYKQNWLDIFNEENPSGNVVDSQWNERVLTSVLIVGILVSIKRMFVTLMLGKQTFARFGEELAEVMKNMMLIGEVASLARDIEKYSGEYANTTSNMNLLSSTPSKKNMQHMIEDENDEAEAPKEEIKITPAEAAKSYVRNNTTDEGDAVSVHSARTIQDEEFTSSEQLKLSELLDAWEEPQTQAEKEQSKISIGAVLQFRQALTFMRTRYPFLPAFGLADSRERCIDNAGKVFDRLMLRTPDRAQLPFDTLALLAKNEDDGIDEKQAKTLIRIFRPDREGNLSKLDFVKSIDEIYKSIRMLSANISNSSQIDKAVEKIINIIFYIVLGAIILSRIGVDPMEVFLSLSGLTLAFAFMFGSSSANFFEGVLFILVHSPYGVGDRVHFSYPSEGTSIDGSSGWIVERVALYTTSLYWGATNERCTINNGALSRLRVINSNRSPNAQIFIFMKFSIDTPYEKFQIARAALEQYCKDRPREWLSFFCFRPTDAAIEGNYVHYMTIATHRDKWQNVGAVLQSKSEMVTYQLEVIKALGIKYEQPHQPVDVSFMNSNGQMEPSRGELGPAQLGAMAQEG